MWGQECVRVSDPGSESSLGHQRWWAEGAVAQVPIGGPAPLLSLPTSAKALPCSAQICVVQHLNASVAPSECRFPTWPPCRTAAASPDPGISPMSSPCALRVHQGSGRTKQYRPLGPTGALVSMGAVREVQSLLAWVMVQTPAQTYTRPKALGVCQALRYLSALGL